MRHSLKNNSMLAGVLHGPTDLRIQEVASPLPQSNEVLLAVRQAGICGSDIHYYQHGYCGAFKPSRPFTLGHELVGSVVSAGDNVDTIKVGQRVVVNPARSCGHCEACESGRRNLCTHVVMLGSASTSPPTDGAFAEFVVVSAGQCHAIPNSMADDIAVMMEPLSVALHAIRRSGGVDGKNLLISGGGPIGLLCLVAARALGANHIVMAEPSEARRRVAMQLGADHALDPTHSDSRPEDLARGNGGCDVVLEASGAAPAVQFALQVVRRGGTIVQIGTIAVETLGLPANDIMARELSLLGAFRYADEFHQAIRLTLSGRLDLRSLITSVFPLSETPHALKHACTGDGVLKVQVNLTEGK